MRTSRAWSIVLVFTLMSWQALFSQDKKASFKLEKESIKIGEQIPSIFELRFPVTDQVDFPVFKDTITKSVEIVRADKIDTNYEGNNLYTKVLTQKLWLTSFDTGFQIIPPITVYAKGDSLMTDPILIKVEDVDVEMPEATSQSEIEIKDIKGIRSVRFSIMEWLKEYYPWLLAILVLFIAVWAYFKYIHPKFRRSVKPVLTAKKIIPPHVLALKKLRELRDLKLWQQGKVKEYHIDLSEIIREYIENQFRLPALESTTSEVLEELRNYGMDETSIGELMELLELSDLVKFAKHQPLPDENDLNMRRAKTFVEATKPAIEEEVAVQENTEIANV